MQELDYSDTRLNPPIRTFATGATRDTDVNKLDYEGFLSPLVLERYAEYMNLHRKQQDGNLRPSDNWQKGIPRDQYMKSMWRHFMSVWKQHRGHEDAEDLETALCALLFNASGMLHEILVSNSSGTDSPQNESRPSRWSTQAE